MPTDLSQKDRTLINNDYYDTLGGAWSSGQEDAIELLKAEGRLKTEWVKSILQKNRPGAKVLDVGCGGGFLTNDLVRHGFEVTGLDQSQSSLDEARRQDVTGKVNYVAGDAYQLPFENATFDVVTCFDFLEHVSEPCHVLREAVRVLKPQGLFFYHTFDQNLLSGLIVIKGVEWFVQGAPKDLHKYSLFIPRRWWNQQMQAEGLQLLEERGIRPVLNASFWRLLRTRKVDAGFQFCWTRQKMISYAGLAKKV